MRKCLFIFLLGLMPLSTVYAVKMSSLYQAELPVTSQSYEDRQQAVTDGFLQVLIKLSGNPDIAKNPAIKPNLTRADYYVQDFSYSAPTTDSSQYIIRVRYNIDDVNRLLKKTSVAYWGENRPLVIVWLAVATSPEAPAIVDSESSGDLLDKMKMESKKLGLPLIFPVMDVADMDQVTVDDVNLAKLPVIKAASKRYEPGAYLIGNVQQVHGEFQSQWQLILNDKKWTWSLNDKKMNNIVITVLDSVNQTLAKNTVVKPLDTDETWLKLEVVNVTERVDLAHLTQFIEQLTPVQQVELSEVEGAVVQLAVKVRGSLSAFQKNVLTGQHLVFKSQDNASNKLVYEWVK
jgi:hypothetical protein